MKKLCILFILLTLSTSLLFSCSKKKEVVELKYTVEEFTHLAHETSNESGSKGPNFSEYAPGVKPIESKALVYKRLPFYAVSFEHVEQARLEALRLNQYYARNWLFDRVEGEPILEDYVIKTFHAINPKRKIQRIPKPEAAAHGEAHEALPSAHH